jgi:hypothetical protein
MGWLLLVKIKESIGGGMDYSLSDNNINVSFYKIKAYWRYFYIYDV